MAKFPMASLGAVVALLGSGLALITLFQPPITVENHSLPAGSAQDEALEVTFSAPSWLRSGVAEEFGLDLRRDGGDPDGEAWLAAPELHAGGAVVRPAARQSGPLKPGDQVTFRWALSSQFTGSVPAEIAVRLRWDEAGSEEVLWAEALSFEVRDYLGLDAPEARAAGALAAVVGLLTTLIGRRSGAR